MPELKDSTHKDNTTIDHQSALSSLQNSFYRQITTTPNSNPHFHNSFEIQYAINEPVNVHLDKDTYVLEKGHFAMILPNQIHWCTASPRCAHPCDDFFDQLYARYRKTDS